MKKTFFVRFVALLSVCALVLTGCGGSKAVLSSSTDEKTVIGKVADYDVPMEIYKYVALNYREDYEKGDPNVWLGEGGAALLDELSVSTDETVVRLYTTVAMCEDYGIHPDDEYIVAALDARMESIYESYSNNYDVYKTAIANYNMNDSVYRFLMRNDIMSEELLAKMIEKGEIPAYSEDFRNTVTSDEFVRVKQILIYSSNGKTEEENLDTAKMIKARLDKGEEFETLLGQFGEDVYMFSNTDGYYLSRGSYYTEFEDTAFSLEVGEISDIVKTPAGFCIIKRYEKDEQYIDGHLTDLYATYRDGLYNLALEGKKATLSVEWNDKAEKYTIFNMKSEQ